MQQMWAGSVAEVVGSHRRFGLFHRQIRKHKAGVLERKDVRQAKGRCEMTTDLDKRREEMRFRKKPIVISASRYNGSNWLALVTWINHHSNANISHYDLNTHRLEIATLEGIMEVAVGDWVIRGVKGEFYPCKPDIFEASYESEDTAETERDRLAARVGELEKIVEKLPTTADGVPVVPMGVYWAKQWDEVWEFTARVVESQCADDDCGHRLKTTFLYSTREAALAATAAKGAARGKK